MSTAETTATPAVAKPEINKAEIIANSPFANGFHITRNGHSASLDIIVGTRKAWEGVPFPAFQLSGTPGHVPSADKHLLTQLDWLGAENVINALNVYLRRVGQDFIKDATPETGDNAGILNIENLKQYWTELAAAGLKISELEEQLELLQKDFQKEVMESVTVLSTANEEQRAALAAKFTATSAKINGLRDQLEKRKRKPSKEKAVEEVSAE